MRYLEIVTAALMVMGLWGCDVEEDGGWTVDTGPGGGSVASSDLDLFSTASQETAIINSAIEAASESRFAPSFVHETFVNDARVGLTISKLNGCDIGLSPSSTSTLLIVNFPSDCAISGQATIDLLSALPNYNGGIGQMALSATSSATIQINDPALLGEFDLESYHTSVHFDENVDLGSPTLFNGALDVDSSGTLQSGETWTLAQQDTFNGKTYPSGSVAFDQAGVWSINGNAYNVQVSGGADGSGALSYDVRVDGDDVSGVEFTGIFD